MKILNENNPIIRTTCDICGTPVTVTKENEDRHRRGDNYYCQRDFEETSGEERAANNFQQERYRIYKQVIS